MNNYLTAGEFAYQAYVVIPDYGKFWVMFDLDNGNAGKCGYAWIFRTKALAIAHRRAQRKKKHSARLSAPVKVEMNKK